MPAFETLEANIQDATERQTAFAASKVRLFKSTLIPTPSTTKAEFVAAEADYTDYPAGGEAIATWLAPILNPAGGASISAPTVQFDVTTANPPDTNLIGGAWLEDAAGKVRLVMPFAAPVPMEVQGQGFPLNLTFGFPTGQTI
jgi:hypothetical protein